MVFGRMPPYAEGPPAHARFTDFAMIREIMHSGFSELVKPILILDRMVLIPGRAIRPPLVRSRAA